MNLSTSVPKLNNSNEITIEGQSIFKQQILKSYEVLQKTYEDKTKANENQLNNVIILFYIKQKNLISIILTFSINFQYYYFKKKPIQQQVKLLVNNPLFKIKKSNLLKIQNQNQNQYKVKKQQNQLFSIKQKKYYIGSGNNSQIIRRIMQKRKGWVEIQYGSTMFVNLKWQQSSRGYQYNRLVLNNNYKQLVNHFEFHQEITEKHNLIKNLTSYCQQQGLNVFDITPITFILDANDDKIEQNMQEFFHFYEKNMPYQIKKKMTQKLLSEIKKKIKNYFNFSNNEKKMSNNNSQKTKYKINPSYILDYNSPYMWLLKPTFLNRGRGINIFTDLISLEKYIGQYINGTEEKILVKKQNLEEIKLDINKKEDNEKNENEQKIANNSSGIILKVHSFVIQKYIEKPFLINKRKFDFRIWSLLTQDLDLYFFKEGYIRTSSEEFQLDANSASNQFIHLTNNAIQQHAQNYGQFESGNQMSFQEFEDITNKNIEGKKINFNQDILKRMKEIVFITFDSIKKKVDIFNRKFCFEIFGFDFILDANLHLWLIEVNTNPCLEQSSVLLKKIMPRMIDDAFKLTVDQLFPKNNQVIQNLNQKNEIHNVENKNYIDFQRKQKHNNSKIIIDSSSNLFVVEQQQQEVIEEYFPVEGYSDNENMWQFILKQVFQQYFFIQGKNLQIQRKKLKNEINIKYIFNKKKQQIQKKILEQKQKMRYFGICYEKISIFIVFLLILKLKQFFIFILYFSYVFFYINLLIKV
ncbi:hypothetical protein IMG5_000600 [Ichthyophthirius multifiliis]|uniref:Tubulin--tyrosine ligase n=1 Tax=Ichthyophthirius multifiliis TaxID=5932 RepID=G0QIU6_ICHMU|nr:hypothetical protein IMG5_000600 [Ichthyophthirius multifiliis]EGR34832.1 hypothetical protein IMG5_000600 [Ichthyophthirius multifiliis]|eukprot:XP_004040136.1 hypothetical protein IMG5_000600 [Ichthyophthirius multifiliis]